MKDERWETQRGEPDPGQAVDSGIVWDPEHREGADESVARGRTQADQDTGGGPRVAHEQKMGIEGDELEHVRTDDIDDDEDELEEVEEDEDEYDDDPIELGVVSDGINVKVVDVVSGREVKDVAAVTFSYDDRGTGLLIRTTGGPLAYGPTVASEVSPAVRTL